MKTEDFKANTKTEDFKANMETVIKIISKHNKTRYTCDHLRWNNINEHTYRKLFCPEDCKEILWLDEAVGRDVDAESTMKSFAHNELRPLRLTMLMLFEQHIITNDLLGEI